MMMMHRLSSLGNQSCMSYLQEQPETEQADLQSSATLHHQLQAEQLIPRRPEARQGPPLPLLSNFHGEARRHGPRTRNHGDLALFDPDFLGGPLKGPAPENTARRSQNSKVCFKSTFSTARTDELYTIKPLYMELHLLFILLRFSIANLETLLLPDRSVSIEIGPRHHHPFPPAKCQGHLTLKMRACRNGDSTPPRSN